MPARELQAIAGLGRPWWPCLFLRGREESW